MINHANEIARTNNDDACQSKARRTAQGLGTETAGGGFRDRGRRESAARTGVEAHY